MTVVQEQTAQAQNLISQMQAVETKFMQYLAKDASVTNPPEEQVCVWQFAPFCFRVCECTDGASLQALIYRHLAEHEAEELDTQRNRRARVLGVEKMISMVHGLQNEFTADDDDEDR